MNLTQLLALLRAAGTDAERAAVYDGLSYPDRSRLNGEAEARIVALHGNQERTADESSEMMALLPVAEELDRRCQIDIKVNERAQAIAARAGSNPTAPVLRSTPQPGSPVPGPVRETTERVATDVFVRGADGRMRLADGENFVADETLRAIAEPAYQRAYVRYLLGRADKADRDVLQAGLASRAWNSGVDSEGGYLAPPQFVAQLIERQPQEAQLFDLVNQAMTTSALLQYPRNNYTASAIYNNPYRKSYVGEADTPSTQSTPSVGLAEIPIHECKIQVPITRQNREDAAFDMDGMIVRHLRSSFRLNTEADIATNIGAKGPRGILANPGGGTMSDPDTFNIGSSIDPDKLIEFYREVKNPYRKELVCSEDFFAQAEKLKDAGGNYVLAIDDRRINATTNGPVERFRGKPVHFSPFYPDAGSANNVMTWGDHREAYTYALRVGMAIYVDDQPREDYVYFVLRARDGGQVIAPWALKVGVQS